MVIHPDLIQFPELENKFVSFKVHIIDENKVYAFCDPQLIGKTFIDKTRHISLFVNPDFYQGESITIIEALDIIRNYPNCNIFGSLAYYAVKAGICHKHAVLWIKDQSKHIRIPHLLLMRV